MEFNEIKENHETIKINRNQLKQRGKPGNRKAAGKDRPNGELFKYSSGNSKADFCHLLTTIRGSKKSQSARSQQ